MKILILGQGGREHAFVKAFKRTAADCEIHVFPGNDGIVKEALCFTDKSLSDTVFIEKLCAENRYDFIFIGPEDPLVNGLSDRLRNLGFNIVGPSQHWAQLEGSKIFAKEFMIKANIPTAKYVVVESVDHVKKYIHQFTAPYVLKADGLAAGKGVFICDTPEELFTAAQNIFEKKTLGSAGSKAALEQFTSGWELSYLFFTNGKDYVSLPIAQDHKRLYNNQKGPNTGGMGTWAPLEISNELDFNIRKKVIEPTMAEISKGSSVYRGVIFLGIMVNGNDPSVIEYNVRMGDPETQSILPLIESNLGEFLLGLSKGHLGELKLNRNFASCVVLTSPGYPDSPKKGLEIEGYDSLIESELQHMIAAGIKKENNQWTTQGGRVLGAVGVGGSKDDAIKNAYSLAKKVKWSGIHFRTDIGTSN
jgi:phosphoribosylamine--glycine ligase